MLQTLNFAPPVISIDVEDWPQSSWDRSLSITERAAKNTRHLLDVLDRASIRATTFILGKLAERFPDLVREIHARGHEIASHGYGHIEIFTQTPEQFADDVRRSKDLLEQITGERVHGYRAPDFSIVHRSLWALEVLTDSGFTYDSSIFPVRRPRYGIPDWPLEPTTVRLPSGRSIVEFPIASYQAWGKNWPVGGGGYHRILPGLAGRWFARQVMQHRPFVFYCHPYEFDPGEFAELSLAIPLKVRLHQGLGRSCFESRFMTLVRHYGGRRITDLLAQAQWPELNLMNFEATSLAASSGDLRQDHHLRLARVCGCQTTSPSLDFQEKGFA